MTVTQTVPILMSPWSVSWSEVWQLCVVSIVDGYNSKATPMIFISSLALGGCWQVVIIINCTTVEWLSYFLYPSVSLFTFLHQLSSITKPSSSYYEYLWRGCSVHWELQTAALAQMTSQVVPSEAWGQVMRNSESYWSGLTSPESMLPRKRLDCICYYRGTEWWEFGNMPSINTPPPQGVV